MTSLVAGLLGGALAGAVADWAAVWRGGPAGLALERLAKPATLLVLIAAAIAWPVEGAGAAAARPWLVAGLIASLAGDVLLLPPGRFVPGLVAFLVAHVAYLVAFLLAPAAGPGFLVAGVVGALALGAVVGRVLVGRAARAGLGIPVAAYLVVIAAMAVAATRTGEPVAIAGAWLFVTSDSLLGWLRFRDPSPGPVRGGDRLAGTLVMVTYHLAQVLIVLALVG